MKSYTYEQRVAVEKASMDDVKTYLYSLDETIGIADAEKWEQINEDVDFTWLRFYPSGKAREVKVEIKFDTQGHKTGNLAFETISNTERNSPGCFIRTKSNLFFYYFVRTRELWIMDTLLTQKWFAKNEHLFKEFKTSTKYGPRADDFYITKGRLVPRTALRAASEKINLRIVSLAS